MMKTIVAMYDDIAYARQAVEELVNVGIDRDRVSLIAGDGEGRYGAELNRADDSDVGGGVATGAIVGGLGGLALGLAALAIPGIGPVVAAGPLAAALTGAGVGAVVGGLIGALTEAGVPEEQAGYYAEGVRRGSTLVTIETPEHRSDEVVRILERHNPIDVDERAMSWRQEGWTGFDADDSASTYTTMQTNQDRARYGGQNFASNVEDDRFNGGNRSSSFNHYDSTFRTHWQNNYANRGYTYEQYEPAYRYGYTLANDARYQGRDWDAIEMDAQRTWSQEHQDSPWENFKDAVRHGWHQVKEKVTG